MLAFFVWLYDNLRVLARTVPFSAAPRQLGCAASPFTSVLSLWCSETAAKKMPPAPSDKPSSVPPPPSPSNPVLLAHQSQWLFTDAELLRAPSILDGMDIDTEHTSRGKGVNFIMQVGIMLKLPQLTLCTASVYLHRFFMRYSMVDLPQRPGMHPYSVGATALFLATKVEENCRKMRELIIACCRVALKQPNVVVDEQSKEFWKWRDTILHNEDLLLEALCFDLQLEQPYRLLYDFLCYFNQNENKQVRNSAWAFINDSFYTVLCVQFPSRTIAAAALYAAARHSNISFDDDDLGRPWWEQIDVDLRDLKRACGRMAELYEKSPMPKTTNKYKFSPENEDETTDKTRHMRESAANGELNGSASPGSVSERKRRRDEANAMSFSQLDGSDHSSAKGTQSQEPERESDRSPKRQRREEKASTSLLSATDRSSQQPQTHSQSKPQSPSNRSSQQPTSSNVASMPENNHNSSPDTIPPTSTGDETDDSNQEHKQPSTSLPSTVTSAPNTSVAVPSATDKPRIPRIPAGFQAKKTELPLHPPGHLPPKPPQS